MLNWLRLDSHSRGRRRFNSGAGFSQSICALTSFLSSALGPFALDGISFSKWIIYTTGYFLILSFQRTIYLENHLLDDASQKYWNASYWVPILIFFLPFINYFTLGYEFSEIDILFLFGFVFALIQDRYRYLYLTENSVISLTGDFFWLVSSGAILLVGLVFYPNQLSSFFLLQIIVGPVLGTLPLAIRAKSLQTYFFERSHLQNSESKYLGYVRAQFILGSVIAMIFSLIVVRFLPVEQLKSYKVIQTMISPYQSIANILAVSIFAKRVRKTDSKSLFSVLKFSGNLLLAQIVFSGVLIGIYESFKNRSILGNESLFPSSTYLAIALIGPILMLSAIPLSAYMRSKRMGREIFISGTAGSISIVLLAYVCNMASNLFGILISVSVSTALTVFLSIVLTFFNTRREVSKLHAIDG